MSTGTARTSQRSSPATRSTRTLLGARVARVSGVAPRARVAIYKACWLRPGDTRGTCATSDLVRAIDDAVADGVDLINYSIGSLETDLDAPDDLALLDALDAGVLSVVAAGNDGPDLDTIGSPSSAPWVLTTAASTQDGELFDDAIEITAPTDLTDTLVMREASFTPPLSLDDADRGMARHGRRWREREWPARHDCAAPRATRASR